MYLGTYLGNAFDFYRHAAMGLDANARLNLRGDTCHSTNPELHLERHRIIAIRAADSTSVMHPGF